MLEELLKQFKESPGPLKPTRMIVGDFAEEILDLTKHYLKRFQTTVQGDDSSLSDDFFGAEDEGEPVSEDIGQQGEQRTESKTAFEPERSLEVSEPFAVALDFPKNKKNQEFKVLAIFYDTSTRGTGPLSAREASNHGKKLGLKIRHENVRKVVRMRLGDYVEILKEERGQGTLNKYRISPKGTDYFSTKYLENQA